MPYENVLPQFSQEFIHQNLRKYIQIALLFFKKGLLQSVGQEPGFDLFIWLFPYLNEKFISLVEWFERFDVQHFYNLAAGCVKDAAEFGCSPPCEGNCAWSGVLTGGEERLHLLPSTAPVGKMYCRAAQRSATICCSSGENWPGPSNYYLQLDYSQLE